MGKWSIYLSSFSTQNLFQIHACVIRARKAKHLNVTTMSTYSHANTPLRQSERAYYLSYFINVSGVRVCIFVALSVWMCVAGGQRPLDSRMRTSTRFDLKFFLHILKLQTPRKSSFYHFLLEKLALLPLLKEVTPSPHCKMIKLLTFDNLFPPLRHSC